jgi:putative phosphoserine phosphatase / 1-acylglycerol-3-phosphate O-acyltransferase
MTELPHAHALAEVEHGKPGPEVGAFFDLDGTLVAGFTAAAYLQHRLRQGELDGSVVTETLRLGLEGLLGRIGFEEFLELSLGTLAGRSAAELTTLGDALFEREIRGRLQLPIIELVAAHQIRGHRVVLASSATSFQVVPVADALGIEDVLCNRLVVDLDGRLTGQIEGPVIWAAGKARAAQAFAEANGIALAESYFYADGSEDVALMYLVGHPRPVNPARRMRAAATRRGWPVIRVPESPRLLGVPSRRTRISERVVHALGGRRGN